VAEWIIHRGRLRNRLPSRAVEASQTITSLLRPGTVPVDDGFEVEVEAAPGPYRTAAPH
jgi:hypothetical protein